MDSPPKARLQIFSSEIEKRLRAAEADLKQLKQIRESCYQIVNRSVPGTCSDKQHGRSEEEDVNPKELESILRVSMTLEHDIRHYFEQLNYWQRLTLSTHQGLILDTAQQHLKCMNIVSKNIVLVAKTLQQWIDQSHSVVNDLLARFNQAT